MSGDYKTIKKKLDEVSPSFCLAKWQQLTLHLQNGFNHSCHHPIPHKVPLDELATSPAALHNTKFKKLQRVEMLQGTRPKECDYCWRIEDASPNNFSDRMVKSSDEWAMPFYDKVRNLTGDEDVNPSYLEVSFGNECNFKCAYCSPWVSSAILSEYHKFGAYRVFDFLSPERLKQSGQYPYSKTEENPYVDAFWKWWPGLAKDLRVFRITGGEPLLNPNTFQFLEEVIQNPRPELDIAINSNLGVPDSYLDRFIQLLKKVEPGRTVKQIQVYTSVDTWGTQAEYIRFGLNYEKFFQNIRKLLDSVPSLQLVFMSTYNVFSVPRYELFLKDLRELKLSYPHNKYASRVQLSLPYLRYPPLLAANILPKSYLTYVERCLDYILRSAMEGQMTVFGSWEIDQFRRILEWLRTEQLSADRLLALRTAFFDFVSEYDERKGLDFLTTFPEFEDFKTEFAQT